MITFPKGSFTRFFPKNGPRGGGAFYQISRGMALTTCIQLYSKSTQKEVFFTLKGFFLDSAAQEYGGSYNSNGPRVYLFCSSILQTESFIPSGILFFIIKLKSFNPNLPRALG